MKMKQLLIGLIRRSCRRGNWLLGLHGVVDYVLGLQSTGLNYLNGIGRRDYWPVVFHECHLLSLLAFTYTASWNSFYESGSISTFPEPRDEAPCTPMVVFAP